MTEEKARISLEPTLVGVNGQLTYLVGNPRDLNRTHRRAIGISETDEEIAARCLMIRLYRLWITDFSTSIWRVEFGATLQQWDIRKRGRWYRRKVK